jgi:chromosome segregation ATPase
LISELFSALSKSLLQGASWSKQLDSSGSRLEALRLKLDGVEKGNKELVFENETLEAAGNVERGLRAELERVNAPNSAARAEAKKEQHELKKTIAACEEKLGKSCGDMQTIEVELGEQDGDVELLQTERRKLSMQVKRQHQRLESAAAQLTEMETLWEAVEEENTSVSKELRERNSEVEILQRERGELTIQVERHHEQLESAATQLTDMEASLLSCQDDLEAAEMQVNALEGQLYGLETNIKEAEKDKQRLSEATHFV